MGKVIEEFETENYRYEKVLYELDERCYRYEPSENLKDKNMEGAMVKKRISYPTYMTARGHF
jgi:hypothetical protein